MKLKKFTLNTQIISKYGLVNVKAARFADNFREKEKMEEKIYIDKKERELMKKLLEKLNTDDIDVSVQKQEQASKEDQEALSKILKKHKVEIPEELFKDIIHWKKGMY